MIRLVGAVVVGIIAMVIVVMVGTAAAVAALVPGGLATMRSGATQQPPPIYLAANLGVTLAAAILGGWLAVRLTPTATLTPAVCVAGIILVMGLMMAARGPQAGQPAWYPWVITAIMLMGTLVGGWWRTRP